MSVLPSIQMGWNALRFDPEDKSSSLTIKSEWLLVGLRIDLPKLAILRTQGDDISESFGYPRYLTLQSVFNPVCFITRSAISIDCRSSAGFCCTL